MNELTTIQQRIHEIRGQRVMLDFDLAQAYGVETRRLNEQVKRNIERFPEDFMFQLTRGEWEILKSQIVTTNLIENQDDNVLMSQFATSKPVETRGGTQKLPYAFTELGVAMLSSVLRSPIAIQVNIGIMRTFFQMRQAIATLAVPAKLDELESKIERLRTEFDECLRNQNEINDDTRAQLDAIATALAELQQPPQTPRRKIGFVQD